MTIVVFLLLLCGVRFLKFAVAVIPCARGALFGDSDLPPLQASFVGYLAQDLAAESLFKYKTVLESIQLCQLCLQCP